MQNEYFFLNELEIVMQEFIEENSADNDFGWLPENISRRMAEAAFAVLKNSKEVTDYLIKEGKIRS